MMKKLMVLSLVLAISAMSSAAFTIDYLNDSVVVSNTEDLIGGIDVYFGIIGGSTGLLGDISYRDGGPGVAAILDSYTGEDALGEGLPWDGGLWQIKWAIAEVTSFDAGTWFSVALPGYFRAAEGQHDIQIDVVDAASGEGASLYLAVVPEPMTMGLLGLGALFLRRRK
ncbi:MAG: PEP-CTERM sorting domain-containing protein [Phycisphaerae bacterium]|nr:PEP-CTERM sorting domain-containing protein [Phycisphaerae bacterium]